MIPLMIKSVEIPESLVVNLSGGGVPCLGQAWRASFRMARFVPLKLPVDGGKIPHPLVA